MTTRIKSTLTPAQRRAVHRQFKTYQTATGQWAYQPHDFDSSFELWSDTYKTRRSAIEAAFDELLNYHERPSED